MQRSGYLNTVPFYTMQNISWIFDIVAIQYCFWYRIFTIHKIKQTCRFRYFSVGKSQYAKWPPWYQSHTKQICLCEWALCFEFGIWLIELLCEALPQAALHWLVSNEISILRCDMKLRVLKAGFYLVFTLFIPDVLLISMHGSETSPEFTEKLSPHATSVGRSASRCRNAFMSNLLCCA